MSKRMFVVVRDGEGPQLVIAQDAEGAVVKAGDTGLKNTVYECTLIGDFELDYTPFVRRMDRKETPPPMPKVTAPDRPSAIEQRLKPTVPLPDLSAIQLDPDDILPF